MPRAVLLQRSSQCDQIGRFRAIWALFQSSRRFFSWWKSPIKMAIFWAIFQNSPKSFILMLWGFSSQPKVAIFVKFSELIMQILICLGSTISRQKSSSIILFKTKSIETALKWSLFIEAVFRRGRIRRRFTPQSYNTSRKIRIFFNFTRRNSSYPGSLGVLRDVFCRVFCLVWTRL